THYLKDVTNTGTNPYGHLGPINTSNCIDCHNGPYTELAEWGSPVNISTSLIREHTETLTSQCDACHKDSSVSSLADVDFHNASLKHAPADDCISCHTSEQGSFPAINIIAFTQHRNINTSDGIGNLTNADCNECHTNISNMYDTGFTTPTLECTDCHNGVTGPVIDNHRPAGVNISTDAYCSECHNNSIAQFAYSANASTGHYATNTSLVTTQDCTFCHKDSGNAATWGGATDPAISDTFPHSIDTSTKEDCYACHNDISASNFHNVSLQVPLLSTVNCTDCHKTGMTMATKQIDETNFSAGVHQNRICENCHADANDTNMDTYSFGTDPAKDCTDCHLDGNFSAPVIAEHNENGDEVKTTGTTCDSCHDNTDMFIPNSGTNGSKTAVTHYLADVTDTSTNPYGHTGPINTSNCIDCHDGTFTEDPDWGTPVNISTSTKRIHPETLTSECDNCHKDNSVSSLAVVDFHNGSVQAASGDNCIGCHTTQATAANLGPHSNFTGTSAVDNGDCDTCHNKSGGSVPMIPGGANSINTYYCEDCHTSGGSGPNISSIFFTDKGHGEAACADCHVADGTYHQGNPRGAVSNTTYVNRDVTGDTTVTNCADCHYASNLDDAPFYAPGAGNHLITFGGTVGACATPGCHEGQSTMVETIHSLSGENRNNINPAVTTPVLSSDTVTKGTAVIITATASVGGVYNLVDGAQYRIENATGEVVPWTPMNADDGDFEGTSEAVNVTIDTSGMLGDYTVQVRAMGGGEAQSNLIKYYPMNGDVSDPLSTTLTVEPPKGYINGTVTSGTSPVSGAVVYTTGASTTTDSNGNYSLKLLAGTYNVTASKQPEYIDNTTASGILVVVGMTEIQNIELTLKPVGNIMGIVTN
ncbi:MAG: hypothetical protein E4G94_02070, partial [ANME-2 cluster archaeon]